MLEFRTDIEWWDVSQLTDIMGTDFSVVLNFVNSNADAFIVPVVSGNNQLWQIGANEFILLSGHELLHMALSHGEGVETLFRVPAEMTKSIFNNAFFYFEDVAGSSHIYSTLDHLELKDILASLIDPMVSAVVEKSEEDQPMLIRIEAPYLTARFYLRSPADKTSTLTLSDSMIETGREAGAPLLCLGFHDCSVSWVRSFEDFSALAKKRCDEVRTAEYYENCGGYLIRGKMVKGIFTQKFYKDELDYEFVPDSFFTDVAIPRLLSENGLVEVGPQKMCSFLGREIKTKDHTIGLSRDIIIITEHLEGGDRNYALEIYGKTCLGIRQIGKQSFLAILTENPAIPVAEIIRFSKTGAGTRYVMDSLDDISGGKAYVYPIFCQLTDDIILFEKVPSNHNGCHNYEMWSIYKNQLVNVLDDFYDLARRKSGIPNNVCHMEKQILVKPASDPDAEPRIVVAMRFYLPKKYCDAYALIDPAKKFRIYGKTYNMLADSMTKKPKAISGLMRLVDNNRAMKERIEHHLSYFNFNTPP